MQRRVFGFVQHRVHAERLFAVHGHHDGRSEGGSLCVVLVRLRFGGFLPRNASERKTKPKEKKPTKTRVSVTKTLRERNDVGENTFGQNHRKKKSKKDKGVTPTESPASWSPAEDFCDGDAPLPPAHISVRRHAVASSLVERQPITSVDAPPSVRPRQERCCCSGPAHTKPN